ncbi:hypothetical protein J5N97_028303 [Dioscorea zingiberensis]|uniref:Uncharacterized protein n=1 Tax=Dioscorea zingiberensis TaxID=325984 RepID=A0A9D5H4Q3_9LILI|nr:hypothetical protein J5N97_028303 [Dioscorea zingiberensis]
MSPMELGRACAGPTSGVAGSAVLPPLGNPNCSIDRIRGFKTQVATCAMKSYQLSELSHTEIHGLKARPRIDFSSIFSTVKPIVDDVQSKGDAAEFHIPQLALIHCFVSLFNWHAIDDLLKFLFSPLSYTRRFDKVDLEKVVEVVSDLPDPELSWLISALIQKNSKVHYLCGSLCSWVIAGCKTIVLATPPGRDGSICKEVLYCAKKAGGAQAIAAMAWRTASCPKVEKVFEP